MGVIPPQSTWLEGRKYHIVRIALFVLACAFIVAALLSLSFTSGQLSRTQDVAASAVKSEQRAEVLVIASHNDSDVATSLQRDGVIDLLNRSSVGVDVEYLDVASCGTAGNVPGLTVLSSDGVISDAGSVDGGIVATVAANTTGGSTSGYGSALSRSSWGSALIGKIRDHGKYAAVVCLDDEALCFVESLHESLFADTPVVFTGVSDSDHAQKMFEAGYATGVVETLDVIGMLDTAKSMNSGASKIVAITDNTPSGLGDRIQFQKALSSVGTDELPVEYLNTSTYSRNGLGTQLASLGEDVLVIYLDGTSDVSGNVYDASQTAYYVSDAVTQPVYAVGFGGVGEGFTGSNFVDYEQEGIRAGEIVVAVLNGTKPADIPLESFESAGTVFDSALLSSYGISSSLLPSGAVTLNQNGQSDDWLGPIFFQIVLLLFGAACLVAFAYLGYRRTATDMAEIVSQRNLMEHRFYTDRLTDIPNMQWLTAYAATDASKKVRSIMEVGLVDLSHLDSARGAGTASEVVKVLAERLEGLDTAFLVRPGRSEFILGFADELKPGCKQIEKVKQALGAPVELSDEALSVGSCIGVYNREPGMSIEEMVAGVDIATQQAVQMNLIGETIFYDADLRRTVEHKLEITTLLKQAIEDEDLVVAYQPQIELATNEVVGYEALVRLRMRQYPPEQFLPVAEMNGQIVDIDRIVTKKVVQQLATWKKRKQRMRPVSINHSTGQLLDDGYLDYLAQLLDEHGVAHSLIRLDLRESLFVNNMDEAMTFVKELHEKGFGLAIDGFSAGYTSLSQVMQIPAEAVKIDRVLTATFLENADHEVVSNLVQMVHSADKVVVVEGVETAEQLQLCREMDCDIAQGFYFAEPMLPERAVQYKPIPDSAPSEQPADSAKAKPEPAEDDSKTVAEPKEADDSMLAADPAILDEGSDPDDSIESLDAVAEIEPSDESMAEAADSTEASSAKRSSAMGKVALKMSTRSKRE